MFWPCLTFPPINLYSFPHTRRGESTTKQEIKMKEERELHHCDNCIDQDWQNVATFDEGYTGWCWILFNGEVVESYHRNGKFHVSREGKGCYNGDIKLVKKWLEPEYPLE